MAPTLLAVLFFFSPLLVKLKWSLMWHIPSVTIQALTPRLLKLKRNHARNQIWSAKKAHVQLI